MAFIFLNVKPVDHYINKLAGIIWVRPCFATAQKGNPKELPTVKSTATRIWFECGET